MMDEKLYGELHNTEIVMENLQDMMLSQEGRNRIKYIDIVTEALANPTKQASLLNKLYKEVQKVEEIDFGKIPDSKGDITKYVYYDQMQQCIEVLNNLVEGNPTPNITSMNKLHQILLSARGDFTFGYRTDNFVIVTMYNLMVTSLYEMINVCAVDATDYLRAKLSMKMTSPSTKQIRWVCKTTNQFIKMYENGQWATLMKTFKSSGNSMVIASEAFSDNVDDDNSVVKLVSDIADTPGKVNAAIGTISPNLKAKIDNVANKIKNTKIPKPIKIVGTTLIILISALFIIRGAIYYFFNCVGKLSDRLKNTATILKANAASENSETALEKQKKMLDYMENISDTIDYKIIKSEKAASADMKTANQTEYNPQEITNISGADFDF